MTKERKERDGRPEELREILKRVLEGRRFLLECGHHAYVLESQGDDSTIIGGREFRISCSRCSR